MQKLLKLKVWITIVLLTCFTNLYADDSTNPSTGELVESNDSVLIAYDDLRIVNAKLIQLEYEKEINNNLRNIIENDNLIIQDYKTLNETIIKDCQKAIKQRNIALGVGGVFFIGSIFLLLK